MSQSKLVSLKLGSLGESLGPWESSGHWASQVSQKPMDVGRPSAFEGAQQSIVMCSLGNKFKEDAGRISEARKRHLDILFLLQM